MPCVLGNFSSHIAGTPTCQSTTTVLPTTTSSPLIGISSANSCTVIGYNGGNVVISTPSTGTSTSLPRINLPSNIQNNMPNKPFTLKFKSARVNVSPVEKVLMIPTIPWA